MSSNSRRSRYQSSSLQSQSIGEDEPFIEPTDAARPSLVPERPSTSQSVIQAMMEFKGCIYAYGVLILTIFFMAVIYSVRDEAHQNKPEEPEKVLQQSSYDYIVVGGGPAGAVMAKKLSDNPRHKVLLLEAGGPSQASLGGTQFAIPPLTIFDIPLFWASVAHREEYHWNVDNAMIAKVLGGCGSHNAMLYVRALPQDFERWNISTFEWDTMLKEYIKLENYVGPDATSEYHGKDGPIMTTPPLFVDEIAPYFIEACRSYGMPIVEDFNHPGQRIAASYYHFNIHNGQRQSAARTFLGPIMDGKRENLEVVMNAEVQRILFDDESIQVEESAASATDSDSSSSSSQEKKDSSSASSTTKRKKEAIPPKAIAVEFVKKGFLYTAHLESKGEVIVTAGAVNTPKVLMKSGIGNAQKLKRAKIPIIKDLPGVGSNLMDHPGLAMTFELTADVARKISNTFSSYGVEELNNYKDWIIDEQSKVTDTIPKLGDFPPGPQKPFRIFASTGLTAGAFLSTGKGVEEPEGVPDIQLTVFPRVSEPHIVKEKEKNRTTDDPSAANEMLITLALLSPEARSSVELNQVDPVKGPVTIQKATPSSQGEYLSQSDVEKLVQAIRITRVLFRIAPMTQAVQEEVSPGAAIRDQAILEQWTRDNVYTNSHWCGSARIGDEDDPMAVLDERMRVRGVEGLRVGDASTFPSIPNGNVHSTVLIMASRGADLVLEDKKKR